MVVGSRCEAGKSPLLTACWEDYRGPLVTDMRALGVSLWQPIHYAEAELMVGELLADPTSRLHAAVASMPEPTDPKAAAADAEVTEMLTARYGLGSAHEGETRTPSK